MPIAASLATQSRRHSYADRQLDLYETPPEAVRALLRVENLPHRNSWEPACGRGAIVNVLRAAGHRVIASDIAFYGPTHFGGRDFLLEPLPPQYECILTNPPYKLAAAFVRHALNSMPAGDLPVATRLPGKHRAL